MQGQEAFMNWDDGASLIKIAGVIIPAEWDQDGRVIGVSISTFDEDEYWVQEQVRGSELIQHVRRQVEVLGWPEIEQGRKSITVKTYKLRK